MCEGCDGMEIKSGCPRCHASVKKIEYQNCGPIVKIFCTECHLRYFDFDAIDSGYSDLIDYWNHLGGEKGIFP